jgi:hypothetical protein
MCRIDHAYQVSKTTTEDNLDVIKTDIQLKPKKFKNEWRNLQSFVDEIEERQKNISKMAELGEDFFEKAMQAEKEHKANIRSIIEKFKIKVNTEEQVHFKELMMIKNQ